MRPVASRRAGLAPGAVLLMAALAGPGAAAYPERPVRLVVGFAPGGATDILARHLSTELGAALGQTVIVENRAGGNGYPAWRQVAGSAPDGHTLLLGENSMAIMPSLYESQALDPRKAFAPVGFIGTAPFVLIVHPSVQARSVPDLVALARAQPGRLQYGSAGNGTPTQLSFEALRLAAGIDALHVPYKGGGPAMVDLLGGHLTGMFAAFSVAKPSIEAGKVRALALTGPRRSASLPDIPTFVEAGLPLPDLDLGQWWGVFAPAGLPADVAATLNAALARALSQPEVRRRLAALSIDIETGPPGLLAQRLSEEITRWRGVIRAANVVGD